jgi:uncharacterized protein YciU (UPF0263 family)
MTKFFHIVQAHPMENGKPNTYKVITEWEFVDKQKADDWIKTYNQNFDNVFSAAVYVGCVNDETGELV